MCSSRDSREATAAWRNRSLRPKMAGVRRRNVGAGAAWLLVLVEIAAWWQCVRGFQLIVYKDECVSQLIEHTGGMVSGTFGVLDDRRHETRAKEDDSDVQMEVTAPSGGINVRLRAGGGEHFQFWAPTVGRYKICFHNPGFTPKRVDFDIYVGRSHSPESLAREEHVDPIKEKIGSLQDALEKVLLEQRYFKTRDQRHRHTNESTQVRLLWYTVFEYVSLVGVGLAQVYAIHLLFRRRIGYNSM